MTASESRATLRFELETEATVGQTSRSKSKRLFRMVGRTTVSPTKKVDDAGRVDENRLQDGE